MYYFAVLFAFCIPPTDCQTWVYVNTPGIAPITNQGGTVILECLVNTSGSGVITVNWKKNLGGSETLLYSIFKLANSVSGSASTEYVGRVNHSDTSLMFLNASYEDSGTYVCDVTVAGTGGNSSSIYFAVKEISPALMNISVPEGRYQPGQVISIQAQSGFCRPYTNHSCEIQRTNGQHEALAVQNQSHFDQSGQNADNTLDPLFGNTVSFLHYTVTENDNQAIITCRTQGDCIGESMVRIHVSNSPTTTSRTSEVSSTSVPPDGEAPLVAVLVTLIIISFIGSLTLCIFVCIKFPDEKVSLKGVVDWICITVVFFCVIMGNICGGVLWRMIDSNQNTGIIALEIILIDVGIFILGIVIGIIKKYIEQKPESDEALRDILVKLPNIVLSVATFGGVSAGIAIAFSCKNGKVRRASITPEETQVSPRKVTPTNSENSVTSQSKVPLQEDISENIKKKSDDIPMQKPKKKKKKTEGKCKEKKTEGKYKEPSIQKVATPRKLPPLKT